MLRYGWFVCMIGCLWCTDACVEQQAETKKKMDILHSVFENRALEYNVFKTDQI